MDKEAMRVFWELHERLPQQGPGSRASTERALAGLPGWPERPRILDLGCGPGRQTLDLARATGGTVTAIDMLPPFVEELRERALEAGLADRIDCARGSMLELDHLEAASFDLVWSEGAIYNVGFEKGLAYLRRFVAPSGGAAVSEATWLTDTPPAEARDFWKGSYPAMTSRAENRRLAERAGWRVVDDFALPESDWRRYYDPIDERIERMKAEASGNPDRLRAIGEAAYESELYRLHGDSYGYVFYVLRPG